MSKIEEKFDRQIVHKTSTNVALAVVGAFLLLVTYLLAIGHVSFVLVLLGLASGVLALFTAVRRPKGFRFLPEGIEELGPRGTSTLIAYADIDRVERIGHDEVVIEIGGRVIRLGREGSREPYVTDVVAELAAYLEASVAEAHALAEDRKEVVAFLARGVPAGDDFRSAPAPRSALEAIARSRVMPARLRIEAAQALGDDVPEALEEEPSNASEDERRRV